MARPRDRVKVPPVPFAHLRRLSDGVGLFEHAELTTPRIEHGYCLDDVARGLVVLAREPSRSGALTDLATVYLRFVATAQQADGDFHNRCDVDGRWLDQPGFEDCWGRALWGLGTVAARMPALSRIARRLFASAATGRSTHPRAMAFAGLGAAEMLCLDPNDQTARSLLRDAAAAVGAPDGDPGWRWSQPRLEYANAALPEVLLAAGSLLDDPGTLSDGLASLRWLHDVEQAAEHFSVTPVGGWQPGLPRPGFDQQPIEVAALADAFSRAFAITGDMVWAEAVHRCADWFLGHNDAGVPLFDPVSGGGCDGLEFGGRNENQGAESTLSMISTFQQAHRIGATRR